MPQFTLLWNAKGQLQVNALVGVSRPKAEMLRASNRDVPTRVPVLGILDTGANISGIDPILASTLGLTPTGAAPVHTPTTGSNAMNLNTFDIELVVPAALNEPPLYVPALPVIESSLFDAQGIHVLVGMDVLRQCLLFCNGPTRTFTVAY